jgi:hypothetical protein
MLGVFTGLAVAGEFPLTQGSFGSQVLDALRVAIVGALTAIAFIVAVLLPIQARAEKLKASRADPRPRWQYLLISACWLSLSACSALAGSPIGTDYLSRVSFALTLWFGVFGLAMLGRAACWGRLRNLFWWHGPTWLANEKATDPLCQVSAMPVPPT